MKLMFASDIHGSALYCEKMLEAYSREGAERLCLLGDILYHGPRNDPDSISVGVPRNADKALMAIRESNGIAINVTDEEILAAQKLLGRTCGVFGEPAGVTGTAAVKKACELGLIEKGATVVSVVTGNGLKDVANAIKSAGEPINIKPDLDLMVEEFAKRGVTVE